MYHLIPNYCFRWEKTSTALMFNMTHGCVRKLYFHNLTSLRLANINVIFLFLSTDHLQSYSCYSAFQNYFIWVLLGYIHLPIVAEHEYRLSIFLLTEAPNLDALLLQWCAKILRSWVPHLSHCLPITTAPGYRISPSIYSKEPHLYTLSRRSS